MKRSLRPTLLAAALLAALPFPVTADASARATVHRRSILRLTAQAGADEAELLIYGPIGETFWQDGVTAIAVTEQLASITATTIRVRVNTDGGVVKDGLAIYNALRRHKARKIVSIDGVAASIGSLICMAGDEVEMPQNTLMMLHGPSAGAHGDAHFHREVAGVLDTHAAAMSTSYATKTKKPVAEIVALFEERRDHWFTAAEAVSFGLADRVMDAEPAAPADDASAAAALIAYTNAIAAAPEAAQTILRKRIAAAAARPQAFARLGEATQGAVLAQIEDPKMKQDLLHLMVLASAAGAAATASATLTPPAPVTGAATAATATHAAAPAATPPAAATLDPMAALVARNAAIRANFAGFREHGGVADLEAACLADPAMTLEAAQARLLGHISGRAVGPLNGGPATGAAATPSDGSATAAASAGGGLIHVGQDRHIEAGINAMLCRASILTGAEADRALQGNPFGRRTMMQMAAACAIRAGVQNVTLMDPEDLARIVLRPRAQQGITDFPVMLEGTATRIMLQAYRLQQFMWREFCKIGTLSDLRDHDRYHLGSFGDLEEVDEHGNYLDGTLSDGEKQTVRGKRKGRILRITPDALINDQLGLFADIAAYLGQASGRSVEKSVFALFALNSGLGPTMSDGKSLFHADHNNLISTGGGAPSVDAYDVIKQKLAGQKDPGGNDFLDIEPAIWLGPKSLGARANLYNTAEYSPDAEVAYVPNTSRGTFRKVLASPRLPGPGWYALADPSAEPVFEVSFLNGRAEPRLTQQEDFRSSGLEWKAELAWAAGAIGWRGAAYNDGTP